MFSYFLSKVQHNVSNLSNYSKNKLCRKTAGVDLNVLDHVFTVRVIKKANAILCDLQHPLMPNRYLRSFGPSGFLYKLSGWSHCCIIYTGFYFILSIKSIGYVCVH